MVSRAGESSRPGLTIALYFNDPGSRKAGRVSSTDRSVKLIRESRAEGIANSRARDHASQFRESRTQQEARKCACSGERCQSATFAMKFRSKNAGGVFTEKKTAKRCIRHIARAKERERERERERCSVDRTLESSGRDFLAGRMHALQSVTNRSFLLCCT